MTSPLGTTIDPDALKYMLSIPKGRAVIWDMLAAFGLFKSSFDTDEHMKDYKLGMHNAALIIYADCMQVSPDLTALMFREQGDYDNDNAGKPEPAERGPAEPGDPNSLGLGRGIRTDLGDD